jgi:hypothetical protein
MDTKVQKKVFYNCKPNKAVTHSNNGHERLHQQPQHTATPLRNSKIPLPRKKTGNNLSTAKSWGRPTQSTR